MSICVTLSSNGGGKEFGPSNHNSEYKIRLPERLKLLDEEWEVEIRRHQGTGKSVYNPRWRDPNGNNAYKQTIVFGVNEIRVNGHFQHQSIFTAILEDLVVAMGIVKAKGNTTPGPSTLVAFQGNDYKKPDTWARFFTL